DIIIADGEGPGSDQVFGDEGDDILIAGGGADLLNGGKGSDLLVSGAVTSFDVAAYLQIQAEWTSPRPIADRVANLNGTGSGPRENGDVFLTSSNVTISDHAVDEVFGGADEDWLTSGEEDVIEDAEFDDIVGLLPI
ncbi:hypothetical protein K2Y11_24230, partial [bacterium]|nr:hypothetical protein [bacterium]